MWKSISTIMSGIFLTDEAIQHILRAKVRRPTALFLSYSILSILLALLSLTSIVLINLFFSLFDHSHQLHLLSSCSFTSHVRSSPRAKGVQCWRFKQSVGESVVIPAGCITQARFFVDCVVGKREFLAREHTSNFMHAAADLRFSTTAPKCVRHAEVLAWDLVRQFVPAVSSPRRRGPVAPPAGAVQVSSIPVANLF